MLNDLAKEIRAIATEKGFSSNTIPEQIANMHSELSEAWEEWRTTNPGDLHVIRMESGKPEGFAVELADCLIRILDTMERLDVDVDECVKIKMTYNATRPHRHGGKRA